MAKKKKGQIWITSDKSDNGEYELWCYKPYWNEEHNEWLENEETDNTDPIWNICSDEAEKVLKIPAHVKRGGKKAIAIMDLTNVVYEKVK